MAEQDYRTAGDRLADCHIWALFDSSRHMDRPCGVWVEEFIPDRAHSCIKVDVWPKGAWLYHEEACEMARAILHHYGEKL